VLAFLQDLFNVCWWSGKLALLKLRIVKNGVVIFYLKTVLWLKYGEWPKP
jgi:hypothetical protein